MSQLINSKIRQSIFITPQGALSYGAHIQGVLGDPSSRKSLSSVLNPTNVSDSADERVVNTYVYVDPSSKKIKQAESTHAWLTGKMKSVNLDSYPESLQKNIISSLNDIKAIYKGDTAHVLEGEEFEELLGSDPVLSALAPELLETFDVMLSEIEVEKKKYANVGVHDFIERYEFRKHIMILGGRGAGKTYTVSQRCEQQGYHTEFLAGHTGIESVDLLGYYVKDESGGLVWMDGPLSAAFRAAQEDKSVLFIDEILRIPTRELHILIGALTPDSSGNYNLRTNRVINTETGLGVSETLSVPKSNLWVVSTTNIGAEYDTEDMDLALPDRFRMIDMNVSASSVRQILDACNDGHFSEAVIEQLMKVYTTIDTLVQSKELTNTMNVRYLCEIIEMCKDPRELTSYFFDLMPNICSRTTDGKINEVEEKTFKHVIKSIIK